MPNEAVFPQIPVFFRDYFWAAEKENRLSQDSDNRWSFPDSLRLAASGGKLHGTKCGRTEK
jgi:hypothetical protein